MGAVYQLPFHPPGPTPPVPTAGGLAMVSSFGLDYTTLGPDFDANGLANSPRVKELEFREGFFTCRQHDWKIFDFYGRMIKPGRMSATQPLIGGAVPNFYVPLDQRRPSTPYRLGRKIVSSYTAMLFGHGRFPQFRSDDPVTQDFADALVTATSLEVKAVRARNIAGACGTTGYSWCFYEGSPRVDVHHGKHLHVLEWEDECERIVRHVVELIPIVRMVRDEHGKTENKQFWRRRDWTLHADIVFCEVERSARGIHWKIDEEQSYQHNDGFAHFVFVENLPDEDESTTDGAPDYAEAYEALNSLDVLNSVIVRGASLNLDPTLMLQLEPEEVQASVIKKGSENALVVGKGGNASYLELSGASLTAGTNLTTTLRTQVLETCECVVPDPDQVSAAGVSSVALKMVYAPMLGRTDVLRFQHGRRGLERVVCQMIEAARKLMPDPSAAVPEDVYPIEVTVDEEGNETQGDPVEYYVALPPRVEDVLDAEGKPTGEVRRVERNPGRGRVWLEWGPYFKPTADDLQKTAQAAQIATGAKAAMSQQTATELLANAWDRDGSEEWRRVMSERDTAAQAQLGMFPGAGGEVPAGGPGGAPPAEDETSAVQPPAGAQDGGGLAVKVELAPTDLAKIVTVNEARRGQGLGVLSLPTGQPDPDGFLTIDEFSAKRAAAAEAGIAVEQKAAEQRIGASPSPGSIGG